MKNIYCRQLLTQNHNLIPIKEMKETWNKDCHNKETLSGYPVYLFNNLNKLGKKCVRPDQMYFFKGKNPYTGRKSRPSVYRTTLPITEEYNNKLCPLTTFVSGDDYVFLVSSSPIHAMEEAPNKIPIIHESNPSYSTIRHKKIVVLKNINPSRIFSLYFYIIRLRDKIKKNDKHLHKNNILKMYLLYDKKSVKTLFDKITNTIVKNALKEYFNYSKQTFSDRVLSLFKQLRIRMPEPVRAFRGVLIHSIKELQDAKLDKLTVGDTIKINSRELPLSWSTDSCLSQYFATNSPARALSHGSKIQFGVLYSCVLKPEQIAIDTRLIDRDFFHNVLYRYDQQEIITFPYISFGITNKFDCNIERLFLVDVKNNLKTIVHSFTNIVPLLSNHI